jgi:hypothetical protein
MKPWQRGIRAMLRVSPAQKGPTMSLSRVHLSRRCGENRYTIHLGASASRRGRHAVEFDRPWLLQSVLYGLRHLERKRATLREMITYLRAGAIWAYAHGKRSI